VVSQSSQGALQALKEENEALKRRIVDLEQVVSTLSDGDVALSADAVACPEVPSNVRPIAVMFAMTVPPASLQVSLASPRVSYSLLVDVSVMAQC
jgi:hypothetical protein